MTITFKVTLNELELASFIRNWNKIQRAKSVDIKWRTDSVGYECEGDWLKRMVIQDAQGDAPGYQIQPEVGCIVPGTPATVGSGRLSMASIAAEAGGYRENALGRVADRWADTEKSRKDVNENVQSFLGLK